MEYATRHLYFPYTHEPLGECVYKENTSDKYYFILWLNLQKTYGNFRKSSEISGNFRKHRKYFKPVFEELKRFMKFWETFGNSSKVFSRCFYDFLEFLEVFGKFPDVIGNVRNGSQGLKSFGAGF